jgi:hypothetical protein
MALVFQSDATNVAVFTTGKPGWFACDIPMGSTALASCGW